MILKHKILSTMKKTKLLSLCLMAVLCFPLMAYSQYYDDVEVIEEVVTEDWDPLQKTRDSLRELSMDYYKDLSHWDIFIEPSVTVQEDTAFDPAGMKHAYYVRRFYFIAVPHASDFRYQPSAVGPYLYAYGQKMPMEARDAQQLQMIRNVVFPFAADFSANAPSSTIFQQYVEKNFDHDYHYIIDSLIAWKISHLEIYEFNDTISSSDKNSVEISQKKEPATIITCLTNEYVKAVPPSTITEAPAREPIESPKSIEQLKNMAVKKQNNIYLLPANAILSAIAHQPSETFFNEERAYISTIAGMTIDRNTYEKDEDGDYIYSEGPASVSGQSYFMLNNNAVLLFPEEYYGRDFESEFPFLIESRNRHIFYDGERPNIDTVLIITPNQIEKMTLKECYRSSLKDNNCTFDSDFPPYLNVFISDDLYDGSYYDNCKECYTKSAILEHLNEGSILYDYFAKDFYKNDLDYTDSTSIGYFPDYYRSFGRDGIEISIGDESDTIYFSKEQSQQIKKLMKKRIHLYGQVMKLKTKAYAVFSSAEIPQGQIHIIKSRWGDWEIEGENSQKEESYDDDLVVVAEDDVQGVVNGTNEQKKKKEPWEKRFEKMEKKFYQLLDKIEEVEVDINTITGHNIAFD